MKPTVIFPAMVAVGLVLLILAFAWPALEPSDSNWSMEDYNEYQDALATGEEISHELEHASDNSALELELEQRNQEAREKVGQLNAKLQQARDGSRNRVLVLKWSGMILIVIGAAGLYMKQSAD